jgi:hypothetical protein
MSKGVWHALWALLQGIWQRYFGLDRVHNPLNQSLAKGIANGGFRKWYERELLSGHAHMVLCLLATIGLMASLEAFRDGSVVERLLDTGFALVCAVVGLWALRRYLALLSRAETLANQATCPACQAYGLLQLEAGAEAVDSSAQDTYQPLRVRCRKCQHGWSLES